MHDNCVELKEARGRTVKKMTVAYDEEYCAVEVEFEDGYSTNVDIIPAVQIRPQFLHVGSGDTKVRRNYKARVHTMGLNIEQSK